MTSSQNQRYRAAQICRPIVVHMRLSHLIEFQFNSISIVCRSSWFLRGCVINWIRILGSIQLSFNFNFNWIEFQFRLFAVSWSWFMCAWVISQRALITHRLSSAAFEKYILRSFSCKQMKLILIFWHITTSLLPCSSTATLKMFVYKS